MDGQPVTAEPSDSGLQTDPETGIIVGAATFTEIFREAFPQYLSMGMSYDEFWNREPWLVKAYRKAWEMKVSQRNWEMWMQGGYIYDALLKVAPVMSGGGMGHKGKVEPGKYPDRPYPLTEKEVRKQEEARRRAALQKMLAVFTAESEQNKAKQEQEKQDVEVSTNG